MLQYYCMRCHIIERVWQVSLEESLHKLCVITIKITVYR